MHLAQMPTAQVLVFAEKRTVWTENVVRCRCTRLLSAGLVHQHSDTRHAIGPRAQGKSCKVCR